MSLIVLDKDGKLNLKSGSDEIYLTMDLMDTIERTTFGGSGSHTIFYTTKGSYGYWDLFWEWNQEESWGTEIRNKIFFYTQDGPVPDYIRMYFDPSSGWSGTLKTEDMWPYDRMNGMLFIDWGENPYDD